MKKRRNPGQILSIHLISAIMFCKLLYHIYTKYVLLLPSAPIGPKKCGCRMRPSETLRRKGEEFILCLRLFNHRWFFKEIQNFSRVHPFL